MSPRDVPTFTLMLSEREFEAAIQALEILLPQIRADAERLAVGPQTLDSIDALGQVFHKMQMIRNARKRARV